MKIANSIRLAVTAGLFILFSMMGIEHLYAQTVWLDQLDLSAATQGFGTPNKNYCCPVKLLDQKKIKG